MNDEENMPRTTKIKKKYIPVQKKHQNVGKNSLISFNSHYTQQASHYVATQLSSPQ